MKKTLDSAVLIVFLGFIFLIMILNFIRPIKEFSELENRYLQQFPEFSVSSFLKGEYNSKLEKFITDQFTARDTWVETKSNIERLLAKKENNGIFITKDGYLIEKFSIKNYPLVDNNIKSINKFASLTDVPVYFSIIPSSAEVYDYRLPKNAPTEKQKPIIDDIVSKLDGVNYIDTYTALNNRNKEYIYYRTDHHWTSRGAFYAYESIAKNFGIEPRAHDSYEIETVTDEFAGTYFSSSGVRYVPLDTIETYVIDNSKISATDNDGNIVPLYNDEMLLKKDKYSFFLGGNVPIIKVVNESVNSGNLLVVRDSYFSSLAQFMYNDFSEVHVADLRYFKKPLSEYIIENDIDRVLIMYSINNFATDNNLVFLK